MDKGSKRKTIVLYKQVVNSTSNDEFRECIFYIELPIVLDGSFHLSKAFTLHPFTDSIIVGYMPFTTKNKGDSHQLNEVLITTPQRINFAHRFPPRRSRAVRAAAWPPCKARRRPPTPCGSPLRRRWGRRRNPGWCGRGACDLAENGRRHGLYIGCFFAVGFVTGPRFGLFMLPFIDFMICNNVQFHNMFIGFTTLSTASQHCHRCMDVVIDESGD